MLFAIIFIFFKYNLIFFILTLTKKKNFDNTGDYVREDLTSKEQVKVTREQLNVKRARSSGTFPSFAL